MAVVSPRDKSSGPSAEAATGRAVTHAVYLTGSLVLLALGIWQLADALGLVVQCATSDTACDVGQIYAGAAPAFVAGVAFLLVSAILWERAQRAL